MDRKKMLGSPKFHFAAPTEEECRLALRVVRIIHGWDGIEDGDRPDCVQEKLNPCRWSLREGGPKHLCFWHAGSIDADLVEDDLAWMRTGQIVLEGAKSARGEIVRAWFWRIVRLLGFRVYGHYPGEPAERITI